MHILYPCGSPLTYDIFFPQDMLALPKTSKNRWRSIRWSSTRSRMFDGKVIIFSCFFYPAHFGEGLLPCVLKFVQIYGLYPSISENTRHKRINFTNTEICYKTTETCFDRYSLTVCRNEVNSITVGKTLDLRNFFLYKVFANHSWSENNFENTKFRLRSQTADCILHVNF